MQGLENGVKQLANYEMNATARAEAVSSLQGIIDDINEGINVWKSFASSGNNDAAPGSYSGWTGFAIETALFEIELKARDKAKIASAGRSSLDDPIIELAYSSKGQARKIICQESEKEICR